MSVDLSRYDNAGFERGRAAVVEVAWMLVSALLFRHSLAVWNGGKVAALRMFGATVGAGVVIKPGVRIKFPWKLQIGDHAWIGEGVWIDNLADVTIGSHTCISQEAFLVCGNHDYTDPTFRLRTAPIVIEDGAWVAARAIVCPGVTVGSHAVLAVGSVAVADLPPFAVCQGNPAVQKTTRRIGTASEDGA
jgi:putative colanic acid biosynthesis acetyltransferase WcaF